MRTAGDADPAPERREQCRFTRPRCTPVRRSPIGRAGAGRPRCVVVGRHGRVVHQDYVLWCRARRTSACPQRNPMESPGAPKSTSWLAGWIGRIRMRLMTLLEERLR